MKIVFKPHLKSKTFSITTSYSRLKEKEIRLVDYKFYQKSLVVLISFLIILIFPEQPKELGYICESYNSSEICKVW
tara:strand:+ start:251 stop:478 length:228 start_codon:yes stop_codon:yes gene_type:complete